MTKRPQESEAERRSRVVAERAAKAAKLLPLTDLRSISRDADLCRTTVTVHLDWNTKIQWLIFGQCQLNAAGKGDTGRWRLEGRITEGVTDQEEDSAYIVRLPLFGVQFGPLPVFYHQCNLIAMVDPEEAEEFHVPGPGYDPTKHPDATTCRRCDPHHIMVPEGYFVPPHDPELFKKVAGKRVEITIGPAYKEEEEP